MITPEKTLTVSAEIIIRILLLVARIVCEDEELKKEILELRNHISYNSLR